MNQLKLSFVLGGALLGAVVSALGGCSDDDGSDVLPKDPTAQAGSGNNAGAGGGGGTGGGAGAGGSGAAGMSGSGGNSDASVRPACPAAPEPVDAGVGDAGTGDAGGADAGEADAGRALSFAADIHPIFRNYCRPCHEDEFSGGHNIAADDPAEAYAFLIDIAPRLVERVNGGGMPPDCQGVPGDPACITVAELQLIQSWEAQCYPP